MLNMRVVVALLMMAGGCLGGGVPGDPCDSDWECCVHVTSPTKLDAVASYDAPSSHCLVAQDGADGEREAFSVTMITPDKQQITVAGHCRETVSMRLGDGPACDLDFECLDDSDRVLMRFDGACGAGSFSFLRH